MTVGKRKLKEIAQLSVFVDVMREYLEPRHDGEFFFDHAPDSWDKEDRRLFDITSEIEHRLKEQVIAVLAAKKLRGVK